MKKNWLALLMATLATNTIATNFTATAPVVSIDPIYVDTVNTITASADTTLCAGDSVQLNASGALFYAWSPATGLSCTNCSNPVAGPLADITYLLLHWQGVLPVTVFLLR